MLGTMNTSPKQIIVETAHPDAREYAVRRRGHGDSWQSIADHLSEGTGIKVSRETVRRWYEAAYLAERDRRWKKAAR